MASTSTLVLIQVPTFQELKEKPKDLSEGLWLVFVVLFISSLWFFKDYSKQALLEKQEMFKAKLAAEKALSDERAKLISEREETIDFLKEQITMLIAERTFLMKATGINSDFLKKEVLIDAKQADPTRDLKLLQ